MATLEDMLDDLRGRLNDAADTQVSEAEKILAINHGIRATWPKLYKSARDSTLIYDPEVAEYTIPAAVGSNTKIVRVEIESDAASDFYQELGDYDFVYGLTDPILSLQHLGRHFDGARIRITAVKPLALLAIGTDVYDGPLMTEELPVLYAMGIIAPRRLDDRIDHRRFATMQNANGVSSADIMEVSQFWFAQFEILLDRMEMPLPTTGV